MTLGRTIVAAWASALVLVAPAVAGEPATVGYEPAPAVTCTTKDAQHPNSAAQPRPSANDWWKTPAQSQTTMRMPNGQNPNDLTHAMTGFPTVFEQPRDSDSKKQVALPVSTCNGRA